MKSTLKRKLAQLFCALFFIVIIVWVVFYAVVSKYVYDEAEKQLIAATNQITDDLNREFSAVEKLCYQVSTWGTMAQFMQEDNMVPSFKLAAEIDTALRGNYNPNFVSDIVAIDLDGSFYRFVGSLSNASCAHFSMRIDPTALPSHMIINALGKKHLGYVIGVYNDDNVLSGYFLMMTDEEKLHEMMYSYAFDGFLTVGIAADEELVTSNNQILQEQYGRYTQNPKDSPGIITKQMGLTPFEAVAALDTQYLQASTIYFSIATVITLLAFTMVLVLFVRAMQKLFVKPMLDIMSNARQIGSRMNTDRLKRTGQEEFDQLVQQINSMISRLDENSRTLFQMQYQMQSAEFEKQQAILISLKKQINAHFTVNTLNVVKRLNETGENEKAGIICDSLSSLLRYANGADEFISCRDELYMLEQYVDIMRIRYPERFDVEFDAEEELDDVDIPRMLLQPIVENAISHGLLTAQNGKLYISARVDGEVLIFKVKDNGKGMMPEVLQKLQSKIQNAPGNLWGEKGLEHVALPNIQKRIVSMFGDRYGFFIESIFNEGTTVTIILPVRREQC